MPKCAQCGAGLPSIDARALWRDGKRICQSCAGRSQPVERPTAPTVGESDVWVPILLLVAMFILGLFSWILGLLVLIVATVYVHYDSKKFGVGGGRSLVVFVFAIVGLPLYAYDLHKLRKTQEAQPPAIVQPSQPAATIQLSATVGETLPTASTKFCHQCRARIPRDSKYCEECGAKLT